jgi:hypothetical protein
MAFSLVFDGRSEVCPERTVPSLRSSSLSFPDRTLDADDSGPGDVENPMLSS